MKPRTEAPFLKGVRLSRGAWVIGIGNPCRSDDAAGLEVAAHLKAAYPDCVSCLENAADPETLISSWVGRPEVVVIDATWSDAPPGTIHFFDAARRPLPAEHFPCTSTHALGLRQCVELARALYRLPRHLWVYGIEGRNFALGIRCSAPVRRAIDIVAAEIGARWFADREAVPASPPPAPLGRHSAERGADPI